LNLLDAADRTALLPAALSGGLEAGAGRAAPLLVSSRDPPCMGRTWQVAAHTMRRRKPAAWVAETDGKPSVRLLSCRQSRPPRRTHAPHISGSRRRARPAHRDRRRRGRRASAPRRPATRRPRIPRTSGPVQFTKRSREIAAGLTTGGEARRVRDAGWRRLCVPDRNRAFRLRRAGRRAER
jgi:hypothetical protein